MQKTFQPSEHESRLYEFWEKKGYLKPDSGEPFTILMPPPNANASLHAGHGMYTIDDILIRWKRMNGYASLWIPGLDHAGFETQTVYEKHLQKQGKSRMDFDRETLYDNINTFVKENAGLIYKQFKRLGFLADWDRSVFTLDEHVKAYVDETFAKMVQDGYIYRDAYIVNYCVHDGTSLADLEVVYVDQEDPLYFIRYPLLQGEFEGKSYIVVATVRPETIFADTHLAVNPSDTKRSALVGRRVRNPLTDEEMDIIADEFVDPEFGTGIVKITPAHDHEDFVVGKKHNVPVREAINWQGRMTENAGVYAGMKVKAAREAIVAHMQGINLIEKINKHYQHNVATCYRCGRVLEPMIFPNWFVKVDELKSQVRAHVENDEVKFHPAKFKKHMLDWLDVMRDWPISRQIVWGIRIPVWYKVGPQTQDVYVWYIDRSMKHGTVAELLQSGVTLAQIEKGLQKVVAQPSAEYVISRNRPSGDYLPETDTFDTWFSSGQWPLVTLHDDEFYTRFPTDFMGTLSDILKFWISRMMIFSLYRRGAVPFKHVYLWSLVADARGQKMSKSKGNVINPIELVDQFGADALRGALLFGVAQGGKVALGQDKVKAMRNYANKVWNIGRFLWLGKQNKADHADNLSKDVHKTLEKMQAEFEALRSKCSKNLDTYKFSRAFDDLYEFVWHRLADEYIESLKDEVRSGNIEVLGALEQVYSGCLQLLHPFMPFVTEAVWQELYGKESSILTSSTSSTS